MEGRTDGQAQSNMPTQLFKSWGYAKTEKCNKQCKCGPGVAGCQSLKLKSGTDNVNADQVWLAVNHRISVTSLFQTNCLAAVNYIYVFHEGMNSCKDLKIHKTMHNLQIRFEIKVFRNKSFAFISMFICIKQRNCK